MRTRMRHRAWRAFSPRERESIVAQLEAGETPCCPRCAAALEQRGHTRLTAVLPGNVDGRDLQCRGCRVFFAWVNHTDRSLYLLRVRRLAAAVLRA